MYSSEQHRSRVRAPLCCIVALMLIASVAVAQDKDSIRVLNKVTVTATPTVAAQPVPVQQLSGTALTRLPVMQLSDAVKFFSGVQVKDYGGIGGLKTVSVRSLGAHHTAVAYDGILVSDVQSGQVDIGKFSLEAVDGISLANAQHPDPLQPARNRASGSLLSIQTKSPFSKGVVRNTMAGIKTGSFGLFNPYLLIARPLGKHWAVSVNGQWQRADGQYPFTLDYGGTRSNQKRSNSDIDVKQGELNIGHQHGSSELGVKVYGYWSERGLPGATVYYNPYSSQRLWDDVFFSQFRYKTLLKDSTALLITGKYNNARTRYLDPDYLNSAGFLENSYHQQEYYVSAAAAKQLFHTVTASLATDVFYNTLDANLNDFAYPSRTSWLSSLTLTYPLQQWNIQATLLNSSFFEQVKMGNKPANKNRLSPSIAASFTPVHNPHWTFRAFYKDIFRMPTFNDLYYTNIGNTKLRPEIARQLNAGAVYNGKLAGRLHTTFSTDLYYNQVTDKIVAIPTKNLFVWTMLNLGKVNITGVDCSLRSAWYLDSVNSLFFQSAYTYQWAVDRTDPASKTYDDQIPYTPRHSGSFMTGAQTRWINISYSIIWSGQRYMLGQNVPENQLAGYWDQSIVMSREWGSRQGKLKLSGELLNLSGKHYEVVKNFPMPGRSFRITIAVSRP